MTYHHCRFCDDWRDQGLVKYGARHYAHYRCYLDAGKPLSALSKWQIDEFPYFLLKDRGLLPEAEALNTEQERG